MARRRKHRRIREIGTDVQTPAPAPEPRKAILSACADRIVPGPPDSLYARLRSVPVREEPAPAPEPRITQRTPGLERLARCGWTVKKDVSPYLRGKLRRESFPRARQRLAKWIAALR